MQPLFSITHIARVVMRKKKGGAERKKGGGGPASGVIDGQSALDSPSN